MEEAYSALCEINSGKGQEVADRNLRRKGFQSSSSHGLEGIDWNIWKDRIHTSFVTALGHSFGAATCIEMLRHQADRFDWLSQGIILDIWSAGTRPTVDETDKHRLKMPLLAINSEAFTYWPSNFEFVSKLTSQGNPSPTYLATVRGTVHLAPSDFPILYPHICSYLLKSTIHPQRAIDLHVDMCLAFLHAVLPHEMTKPFAHAYPPDEWLAALPTQTLSQIDSNLKARPSDRFVASRLKIRHEWKWRLAPTEKMGKRWLRPEYKDREDDQREVWVHARPAEGELQRWVMERDAKGEDEVMDEMQKKSEKALDRKAGNEEEEE